MSSPLALPGNVQTLLADAFGPGFIALILSKRRKGTAAEGSFTKVSVRPVQLERGTFYQFTWHYPRKETHENLDREAATARCSELLANTFEHAHLFTAAADHEIRARSAGRFRIRTSAPSRKPAQELRHNRGKQYLIPEGVPNPFLHAIGVMNREGRVLAARYHKFRQINRFLELVNDVVPHLPSERPLHVFDFGSGKSYLTFALHHLLAGIHGFDVRIVGVDRNADVIADCARIARELNLEGLEFHVGDILSYPAPPRVDLTVALHACDTATDAALAQAIERDCPVILAVPCCQHELAPQIHVKGLEPLHSQGILHERFAALATDALRAAVLEICGYSTQIVEFIDMEHTAKNLLIRAVRRENGSDRPAAAVREYREYKRTLGVGTPYLERALGDSFQQRLASGESDGESPES